MEYKWIHRRFSLALRASRSFRLRSRGTGRKKRRRVFLRHSSFFPRALSSLLIFLIFVSLYSTLRLLSCSLYVAYFSVLLFASSLANLHVLLFSRAVMHNSPFSRSSLSHLHPLVAFVGRVDSLNSPSPIFPRSAPQTSARFRGFFFNSVTHLTSRPNLRALAIEAER